MVGGGGWGSPHWLMTESSIAPHALFLLPASPSEIHPAESQSSSSCVLDSNPPPPPPALCTHPPRSECRINQLGFCFRCCFFFFPEMDSLDLSVRTEAGFLIWLKVSHHVAIWDWNPGSDWGCWPAGFPLGNQNHCSILRWGLFYFFLYFQTTKPNPNKQHYKN